MAPHTRENAFQFQFHPLRNFIGTQNILLLAKSLLTTDEVSLGGMRFIEPPWSKNRRNAPEQDETKYVEFAFVFLRR